jgi:hypothetical protein
MKSLQLTSSLLTFQQKCMQACQTDVKNLATYGWLIWWRYSVSIYSILLSYLAYSFNLNQFKYFSLIWYLLSWQINVFIYSLWCQWIITKLASKWQLFSRARPTFQNLSIGAKPTKPAGQRTKSWLGLSPSCKWPCRWETGIHIIVITRSIDLVMTVKHIYRCASLSLS